MGSWPAPSNVHLCLLSDEDYFCAKQETDQLPCQEQQIPCFLSSFSAQMNTKCSNQNPSHFHTCTRLEKCIFSRAGWKGREKWTSTKAGFFFPKIEIFVIEKMLFWNFPVFGELLLLTLHNFISVHWHNGKYIFYPSLIFTKRFFSPSPSILKAWTVLNSHSWCTRSWKHQRCLSML